MISMDFIQGYWLIVLIAGPALGLAVRKVVIRDVLVLVLLGSFFVGLGLLLAFAIRYSSAGIYGILALADIDAQDSWGLSRPIAFGYILLIAAAVLSVKYLLHRQREQ